MVHPPTAPGVVGRPVLIKEPRWPLVLGVIAIILSGLGVVAYGIQMAQMIVLPNLMPEGTGGVEAMMLAAGPSAWIAIILRILTSILLLIIGIGLISKVRWAITLTWWWIVLKIITELLCSIVQVFVQYRAFTAEDYFSTSSQAAMTTFLIFMILFGILTLLWYLIGPVFMMIWLTRPRVRAYWNAWGGSDSDARESVSQPPGAGTG